MHRPLPLTPVPVLVALTAFLAGGCVSPTGRSSGALDQSDLGTAQSFAVLAGSTVTNTGATTVYGNLGVDPGLAVTGFPPGLVLAGTIHTGDAVALQAQTDTTSAYNTLASETPTATLSGQDLGGMTLTPGVYAFSSSAQLTGMLTLDAQGDPMATFVFQIGSTLTTASNSSVQVINGARDCNLFWQVGSSATLGTTTAFKGNIVALTSITLNTGALLSGRALARNGAVTLDTSAVSIEACDSPTTNPDAAMTEVDAAMTELDAAVPTIDAAVPMSDAAVPEVDAAVPCDAPPVVIDAPVLCDAAVIVDAAVCDGPLPGLVFTP